MRNQLNGKMYLQKLQTTAYLSLGIPLLFFIYIYLESSVDQLTETIPSEYHLSILIPILILSIAFLYWSHKKYKYNIEQSFTKTELKEKLKLYQIASNTRFLVYGACAIMICIGFYLTNYQPFAALYGIMLVLFSINNPNTRKIVGELKLKDQNKEIIYKGSDIP